MEPLTQQTVLQARSMTQAMATLPRSSSNNSRSHRILTLAACIPASQSGSAGRQRTAGLAGVGQGEVRLVAGAAAEADAQVPRGRLRQVTTSIATPPRDCLLLASRATAILRTNSNSSSSSHMSADPQPARALGSPMTRVAARSRPGGSPAGVDGLWWCYHCQMMLN